jgi:EAL domain-containing protein (putative c-di-GMP-specific phosphodiesterase class I)
MQCDFGQGFHFAKPLHPEEILAMATGRSPVPRPAPRS